MRSRSVLILTTLSLSLGISCGADKGPNHQDSDTWQIAIGGARGEVGRVVLPAVDGGFVIAGGTHSHGEGKSDGYLIRIDATGNTLWETTVGGAETDRFLDAVLSPEGDILAVGQTRSSGAGQSDLYLARISMAGVPVWERTYGGSGWDEGEAVTGFQQNAYFLAGVTDMLSEGTLYVVKADAEGEVVWDSRIETGSMSGATRVLLDANSEIMIAGWIFDPEVQRTGFLLVKIDSNGELVWWESYGGSGENQCSAALATLDGGVLLVGYSTPAGPEGRDIYVVKTDSLGNLEWEQKYGGAQSDGAWDAVATLDGGYVLAGWTESQGAGNVDVYLVKIGSDGSLIWERAIGGEDEDIAYAIALAGEEGYIVVGSTVSIGAGEEDVYVIKTDLNGEL